MADIKKANFTIPKQTAIDIDVLVSRLNFSKKDVIISLVKIGLKQIADKSLADILKEMQEVLSKDSHIIERTSEENEKYKTIYGIENEETFKADEEKITYLGGLGDDL